MPKFILVWNRIGWQLHNGCTCWNKKTREKSQFRPDEKKLPNRENRNVFGGLAVIDTIKVTLDP